jgi:hypothetical protein
VKSDEVDKAVKTARQRIQRGKEGSRAEPQLPEQPGLAVSGGLVTDSQPGQDKLAEGPGTKKDASTGRPQDESRAGGGWKVLYASHFPLLGSVIITVPLLIFAAAVSQIITYTKLTPIWVMAVLALAGIAGSAIDYRRGCGASAVAMGINSVWLSGYAIFVLEAVSNHQILTLPAFLYALGGIGFIVNGLILTYIISPIPNRRKDRIHKPLLVFLIFMTVGLAVLSILSAIANTTLLWVPGVMFLVALLADLTGIVLTFMRAQDSPRPGGS